MEDIKIKKNLDQNFTNASYVNTLDDVISIYKSKIILEFPWIKEILVEVFIDFLASSSKFCANEKDKSIQILMKFNKIPSLVEFEKIFKNTFESGINTIYLK
ncbi:hypothetical protein [Flavobacterium eburneipallidum]|uniref:hypothetical protein n=1 Tax=Flavobacterium eburneipallidum TaxID=3003263 RepID=UPI002482A76F|nr:hypothetical protein [Flavobacterium eburneipallidum]